MRSDDLKRGFPGMNRRDFLFGSAAVAAAPAISRLAWAQDAATRAKLDRISLLTNDFDGLLPEIWDRSKPPAPLQLDMMDLPDAVADRLHLHNLEVCNINLLSMEPEYIGKFKERMHKAKSKVVDLIVELDPPATRYRGYISVCSPNPAIRTQAIELTKKWIDIAAVLGSPSIMPDQGARYLPKDLTPCIEGLKALVDYGKPKGVAVILEPRGEPLDRLVELIKGSGAYANPQIGTVEGLRLLYPLARTVQHVDLSPRSNLATAIKISKELGFKGWYSIETDGGPDSWADIQKVIDALLRYL
jgi:Xylose isomerase-like TIM barrel/TAT (twin-arginine translocation) pathway signal sequence